MLTILVPHSSTNPKAHTLVGRMRVINIGTLQKAPGELARMGIVIRLISVWRKDKPSLNNERI